MDYNLTSPLSSAIKPKSNRRRNRATDTSASKTGTRGLFLLSMPPPAPRRDIQPSTETKKRKSSSTSSEQRKRQQQDPKQHQQSISELFTTTQPKPSIPSSPERKRSKLDGRPSTPPLPATTPLPPKQSPLPIGKMYNFPSTRSPNGKNGVIDLTSPTSSPRRPSTTARPTASTRNTFNPHLGAKRLVVKNLRPATQIDPRQYLEETWGKLDKALDIIFTSDGAQTNGRIGGVNGGAPFSMEQLYRGVENGCKQGFAADLCGKLEEKSRKHVVRDFREPLGDGGQSEGGIQGVLRETLQAWKVWMGQVKIVKQICFYMDRSFLLQQGKPSLMEMATAMFRTNMFEAPELRDQIVEGACDLITNARGGVVEGMDTFREAVKMFHELGVYTNVFEPKFLDLSQTYIMAHAKSCAESKTLPEYVRDAVQLMDREMARCEQFDLDQTTRRDLLALLEDHLISNQKDMLIYSDSVADLLDLNAVEDLRSLYSLLARRRLAEKLVPAFGQWINETGTSIVFDEKEEDSMVVKLLTLKKQLDHIWRASFQRNTNLGHILRGQFDVFMNKTKKSEGTWNTDNSKPGEMIAKYVDMLLRGGAKVIPESLAPKSAKNVVEKEGEEEEEKDPDEEEVVNDQLDQVLDLFRFVHGKAVFEAFYKKDLARRLLMNRTASRDAESSMLQRLKTECGSGFTQNLEQMFKDIELGREEMSSYSSLLAERGEDPAVQLDVKVLQGAAWPTYPEIPVLIPMEIKTAIDKFEQHYKAKHSGRKLEWKHALAHCQLKASFPKGQKEVVVSSFQAIVLLQFNGKETDEKVSYDYLKTATGLPEAELKRTLQSLACARLRPLTKHPKGKDIKESDSFIFNSSFSHERYRVKINQVQLKETKQENKETHERVAADRQFETQAAIVRIMKSRKTIGHSELIAEVIKATTTRGVLQPADIKKNIDRLIDKEYMEREDDGSYSYVS